MNYEIAFALCPANCIAETTSVTGRNAYKAISKVCGAALVDNSISMSGGLVGVIRMSGQGGYAQTKKTKGILINGGDEDSNQWSFTTIKINNIDFSKSDLRILDKKGEPSFSGRVEFRVGGRWGSVNADLTN